MPFRGELLEIGQNLRAILFTPLESPAIYGGDEINKDLIPYRKGEV